MLPMRSSTSTGSFTGMLGSPQRGRRLRRRWRATDAVGMVLLALVALCALAAVWSRSGVSASQLRASDAADGLRGSGRMQLRRSKRLNLSTLVVYVYSGSDQEYEGNLMYFLREGVKVSRWRCANRRRQDAPASQPSWRQDRDLNNARTVA